MFEDEDMRHGLQVKLSPNAMLKIEQAKLLLRKVAKARGMPSIADTLEWILACMPIEDMWREHYGEKVQQAEQPAQEPMVPELRDKKVNRKKVS